MLPIFSGKGGLDAPKKNNNPKFAQEDKSSVQMTCKNVFEIDKEIHKKNMSNFYDFTSCRNAIL